MKYLLALIGMAAAAPTLGEIAQGSTQVIADAAGKRIDIAKETDWVVNGNLLTSGNDATGDDLSAGLTKAGTQVTSINKRAAKGDPHCGVGGNADEGPAVALIRQQRDYLGGLSAACGVGPGPAACARVSCSDGAAVWALQRRRRGPSGPPCRSLAPYVDAIADGCREERHHGHITARGQVFDTEGFNVIVGLDDC
ncbi:hypothetical protein Hte_009538 [Hypoxylon texense]